MLTFLSLSEGKSDYHMLRETIRKNAAFYTEQKCKYFCCYSIKEVEEFLMKEPMVDFVSWDITLKDAGEFLARIRKRYKNAFLLIVADITVSPTVYLKPDIAPGALLLKPMKIDEMESVIRNIFQVFPKCFENEEYFLVETREDQQYVPLFRIDYFEAKEKRIFVRTKNHEFGFYDALDTLQNKLPSYFLRCHRSYIVNMNRVKKLILAENLIQMIDDVVLPFSRNYKKILKEYRKNE